VVFEAVAHTLPELIEQFPSVLQTMNESLAWTSELGEAYYNQPGDVMVAIQTAQYGGKSGYAEEYAATEGRGSTATACS